MNVYLSSLPQNVIEIAQKNHSCRLKDDGIYTPDEIEAHVKDLPNQKIADLENSLDRAIYEYVCLYRDGEISPDVTYYDFYDLQDFRDSWLKTFDEIKYWLIDFWNENPDEDMSDEEHDDWIAEIEATTCPDTLDEFLSGIDYTMSEIK